MHKDTPAESQATTHGGSSWLASPRYNCTSPIYLPYFGSLFTVRFVTFLTPSHHRQLVSRPMVAAWLKLALVCLSARGAASFDSSGDVPGSPGNLADAMRGAAWPASLCTAHLHR